MDSSGLGGGFLSGSNGGIIDLESPLHRHQMSQLNHSSLGLQHQHHMGIETEQHRPGSKGTSAFAKGKGIAAAEGHHHHQGYNLSEEDEPSYTEDENCEGVGKGKKGTPWQRMKWTDNMVKLLIAVVACVGDDGMVGGGGGEGLKRKSGVLQKKGKWKTVSKIMISKGCHVSPQQCEDKFNDLNKRYKRLNDILERGTSCRVVENPSLMDSMPHLSTKAKDDVRKILSSKHLFYKEMCAYHNGQRIPDCHDIDLQGCSLPVGRCSKENDNGSDEEEEEEEAEENRDSDDNNELGNEDDNNDDAKKASEEDGRFCESPEDCFEGEMAGVFEDPTKSLWERREWVKKQSMQLEEQRVEFQVQALELEKQRFRWLRYCGKKDRELERLRLVNERMKLANERKVLHLKDKELEFDMRRSEASFDHPSLGIDRVQGRDHIDLSRPQ